MATVRTLGLYPLPLPWDVHPMGRLQTDGAVHWEPGHLPPTGRCALLLWRPGERPPFAHACGTLSRDARGAWRLDGERGEGWILHVARCP